MTELRAIGVDPGPIPGLVLLEYSEPALLEVSVFQCSSRAASGLLEYLLIGTLADTVDILDRDRTHVQAERFVVRRRAGRSSTASAGATTRELIDELQRACKGEAPLHLEPAVRVKGWATDDRLEAAGLLEPTKGMRHARDAARHALFCAVHYGGAPDPLSHQPLARETYR